MTGSPSRASGGPSGGPSGPRSGDLVILVRPPTTPDQPYPNLWRGNQLLVLATHAQVVNAVHRAQSNGRAVVFFQFSPGSRIIGSAEIGETRNVGDRWEIALEAWHPLDHAPVGRSYGASWYWVK